MRKPRSGDYETGLRSELTTAVGQNGIWNISAVKRCWSDLYEPIFQRGAAPTSMILHEPIFLRGNAHKHDLVGANLPARGWGPWEGPPSRHGPMVTVGTNKGPLGPAWSQHGDMCPSGIEIGRSPLKDDWAPTLVGAVPSHPIVVGYTADELSSCIKLGTSS